MEARIRAPKRRTEIGDATSMKDRKDKAVGARTPGASVARPSQPETAELGGLTPRARGGSVVCIAVESPPDLFALCLSSVVAHTPPNVPVLVAELASEDPAVADIVREFAGDRDVRLLPPSQPRQTANLAAAVAFAATSDVALLRSDCVVGAGWLEGLGNAAYSDSHVASASAISNEAGILSVPERNIANRLPEGLSVDAASAAVAKHALRRYPHIPMAVARAVYLRRDALDLAGGLDPSFNSTPSTVIDFSQRCLMAGLVHVTADDVFVFCNATSKFTADETPRPSEATADPMIATRYPFFSEELGESEDATDRPLPVVLARARRALNGISVTLDGRCLVATQTGTQVVVLETIRALAALDSLALRVVVPHDLADFARDGLNEFGVTLVEAGPELVGLAPSDIAHRPFQVSGTGDLGLLRGLGERIIVTNLDLIAYDNPSYFPSFDHWQHHRLVTRLALNLADRVVFVSHDAAAEAIEEQLVDASRAVAIHQGIDYSYHAGTARARPAGTERIGDRPFMVSIGADFHHKNRVFALELLAAMRRSHDWPGLLVLAGPHADCGSSSGEEARFMAANPDLDDAVISLPWISEPEKAWLIENSVAVCHPSTREGFGLMPFEAAAYGRPCIFASTTAFAELQPEGTATIVPWNAEASATRVMALLSDPEAIKAHVSKIQTRAQEFTWKASAERLAQTYEDAMAAPSREIRRLAGEILTSELDRDEAHRKYDELWGSMSKDGHLLVGPDGLLDAEDQRALLTVASRPWLRRVVLGQARLMRRLTRNPTPLPTPPATTAEAFDLHFREGNLIHMEQRQVPKPDLDDAH
jgi:glycosyltransferase involved in cell wall biosynthesis